MTDFSDATDEELVLLSVEFMPAFGTLVNRYEEKLLRYVRRIGIAQTQDAEDVLQDAFLKIYKNLRTFDLSLKFSSWAYRIAHNEAVNFIRHNKRRPQGHYVYDAETALGQAHFPDELATAVGTKIEFDKTMEAMQSLKEKYRDILILRYLEGLEYQEISDVLKLPMGSVATHLHRAKKALAAKLSYER